MVTGLFSEPLPVVADNESTFALSQPTLREQIVRLYDELGDHIYRYLVFLGLRDDIAEEQCQECFLALCSALHAGKRIEHPRKWLFSVAYRLAMDELVKRRQHLSFFGDLLFAEPADPQPGPEQATLELERNRRFHQAVGHLSAQQRNCLYLRTEGLMHREIAEVMGISPKTVSEFLHRAIKSLRNSLR
jgi:RNA polymerase sigma factor (sigma-70 family)